jgi:hypothetical protein
VFGLTPNEDAFDSFGLPYPDLSVTISQIQMEPAANMWEHYNTPGEAGTSQNLLETLPLTSMWYAAFYQLDLVGYGSWIMDHVLVQVDCVPEISWPG